MTIGRLYTLFDFISLFSSITDNPLDKQSPGYICEKFKRYIGEFDDFEFPETLKLTLEDIAFIKKYMEVWGDVAYFRFHKEEADKFKSVLMFLKKANWDSRTLPSKKLEIFKEFIGDYSNIKVHQYHGEGLHPVLNKWLEDLTNPKYMSDFIKVFNRDLDKLNREFGIDSILNDE